MFNLYLGEIFPKVNWIRWLEFDVAFFEAAILHFNLYTTWSYNSLRRISIITR